MHRLHRSIGLRWKIRVAAISCYLGLAGILGKKPIPIPFLYCDACPLSLGLCPFGIIQRMLGVHNIPCITIGILILYGLIFGRSFCGLVCPVGFLQEALWRAKRRVKVKPPWAIRIITPLILVLASISGVILFCKICISGFMLAGIPFRILQGKLYLTKLFILHLIVFILIMVLAYRYGRVWCLYLCPFMILGLFNKFRILLKLRVDQEKCTRCNLCLLHCPMHIEKLTQIGLSGDCILCLSCYDVCPNNAIIIEKLNIKS